MTKTLIRFFDIVFSVFGLIILFPFFLILSVFILVDSKGGVFFLQQRVGKGGKDFRLWKFRTMYPDSEKHGQITVGAHDNRITSPGKFLRKYKLDELPQLINVLSGEMSLVGPRPEVRKYVNIYSEEQKKVLGTKPGITDYASIEYSDESELLSRSQDPLKTYVEEIMPAKIMLNMKYIKNPSLKNYFRIILLTVRKLF
ncbi:MAG: sugar transferase [Bacteroidetes bacterium]|nr:sugar transferase [Bacteroidota bacterium]